MAGFHSPETASYIRDVHEAIEYVNIPFEKAVLLSSGAMYLGARAVDASCRFPQDIDVSVSPEYLEAVAHNLPDARLISSQEGHFYRGRIGDWQVDMGSAHGHLSNDRLQAGAQLAPGDISFASMNHVAEYKNRRRLPKDIADIDFMSRLMQGFEPQVEGSSGLACTAEAIFGNTDASYQASHLLAASMYTPLHQSEKDIIEPIGDEMLARSGVRYGTGAPDFRYTEIDPDRNRRILLYNAMRHNFEVGNGNWKVGMRLGLGERACHGLWVGGRGHDADQTGVIANPALRDGKDELSSAQELIEEFRMRGAPKDVAMWAAYSVIGTQVVTDGTAVRGQAIEFLPRDAFPSDEAMLAAKIGASGDMANLYDDYTVGLGLLPQRLGYENPHEFDLSDSANRELMHKFLVGQRGFLGGYRYPLEVAEEMFAGEHGEKRARIVWIADQLIAISANDDLPKTWQGLIDLVRMLEQGQFVG